METAFEQSVNNELPNTKHRDDPVRAKALKASFEIHRSVRAWATWLANN